MVRIYMKKCDNLQDPLENPDLLEGLSIERKNKILRYKHAEKRRQSLGASLLLKDVLDKWGHSLEDIQYGDKGKPEIKGLFFNLSHSDNMSICAVSDKGNVGCDVEKIKQAPIKLAERYFTEYEINYINKLNDVEKNTAFYRLWTIKESYMKMTGEGIGIGLENVEIHFNNEVEIYRNGHRCKCSVNEYTISEYRIAVCTENIESFKTCEVI